MVTHMQGKDVPDKVLDKYSGPTGMKRNCAQNMSPDKGNVWGPNIFASKQRYGLITFPFLVQVLHFSWSMMGLHSKRKKKAHHMDHGNGFFSLPRAQCFSLRGRSGKGKELPWQSIQWSYFGLISCKGQNDHCMAVKVTIILESVMFGPYL